MASYADKIYTIGGRLSTGMTSDVNLISGMPNIQDVSEVLAELLYLDSYLRIVDFSKPDDPSKTSIDISTDNITTAIRLPDNVPRLEGAALFISDGVMHMLPGTHGFYNIEDENGNGHNTTTYRTNLTDKAWDFDLKSQKWSVHVSEMEDRPQYPAIAFDSQKQVGWFYGGFDRPDRYFNGAELVGTDPNQRTRGLQELYHLERGKGAPIKVDTDSSLVGDVEKGELVYIESAGKAGILVLLGGDAGVESTKLVSMVDRVNWLCRSHCPFRLMLFLEAIRVGKCI